MGKGARKRQKAVQTRQEQEQARLLAAKKKKRNILLGIAGGVVALVVVAALVVNGVLTASGWYLSRTVSVISSSYDIDNAMIFQKSVRQLFTEQFRFLQRAGHHKIFEISELLLHPDLVRLLHVQGQIPGRDAGDSGRGGAEGGSCSE